MEGGRALVAHEVGVTIDTTKRLSYGSFAMALDVDVVGCWLIQ